MGSMMAVVCGRWEELSQETQGNQQGDLRLLCSNKIWAFFGEGVGLR